MDLLVLGDPPKGGRFHGWPVVRRQRLQEEERDRIAALLTSRITYGHLSGLCSSPGLGFHLESKRNGELDVRVDPLEARVQILGREPVELALSMAGVRVFAAVREQFAGHNDCR